MTNEKGVRSYIYILKIYEKINLNEIISEKEKQSSGSFINHENINNNDNLMILNNFILDDNIAKPLIDNEMYLFLKTLM